MIKTPNATGLKRCLCEWAIRYFEAVMRKAAHADHNTLERSDAGAKMRNAIKIDMYVDSILVGALYIL
jgi:hypothetical protein